MPRVPRRRRRENAGIPPYSDELFFVLGYGRHPLGEELPALEMFVACWEAHGQRMLEEWTRDRPGTRPLGWYACAHNQEVVAERGRYDFRRADLFGAEAKQRISNETTCCYLASGSGSRCGTAASSSPRDPELELL
jgi:hypothetical protein